MGCLLIGLPDRVKDATSITATTSASGLGVANLQTVQPGEVHRSTSVAAPQVIEIDLGAAYPIGVVSIINGNHTADATVRIKVGNDATFAVTLADSGTVDFDQATIDATVRAALPMRNHHFVLTSEVTARYVQITSTDTGNAAGYLEIGRIVAGRAHEFEADYPWLHGRQDRSTVSQAEYSGTPYVEQKQSPLAWRLQCGPSGEAHAMDLVLDWLQTVKGVGGDVVVIPQSEVPTRFYQQAGYAWIKKIDQQRNEFWDGWSGALDLEEWLP